MQSNENMVYITALERATLFFVGGRLFCLLIHPCTKDPCCGPISTVLDKLDGAFSEAQSCWFGW